jgi:hypothetical protein
VTGLLVTTTTTTTTTTTIIIIIIWKVRNGFGSGVFYSLST